MKISKAALAAALITAGSSLLIQTVPADAQVFDSLRNRQRKQQQPPPQQQPQQQQQQGRIGELSREESAAIMPLYQAVQAQDWTTASAALPAAQAGARTPYGRYVVGQLMLSIATNTQNQALQSQAVDFMLASGGAPPEALDSLIRLQVDAALAASNFAAAEPGLTRLVEMNPNDVDMIVRLAQVKTRLNKAQEAGALLQRALQVSQASGATPAESLYRTLLNDAFQARNVQPALELGRSLVQAYPTPTNWRDVLIVYRELGRPDQASQLDLYRLMRAAGGMTSERDFVEYAEAANRGRIFGEVKAALDEALARNAITAANMTYARETLAQATRRIDADRASLPNERAAALAGSDAQLVLRLADAYYGYGQYADAVALYRAALQKGGDAGLVNMRLGTALAMAGQRAEAETAFRAVTGPRAELARFWLLWLARRG
jgi:tetratricopeptide (TPR) repeat protein